ncbi:MAG: type I restriction enzyme HsdR N-terminal domain-containing protein [Prevotella sp.]|nr:type I restriction enzyme HsdR N-terminal domain-containing protein [Prevotella sp.]
MLKLNIPPFQMKLSGTQERPKILDILRRKFVALTPEEWVRQHFIHFLIEHKGYPSALMANEVALSCGNKQLRADTVLYDRDLNARMIIEYKAPTIKITKRVFEQVTAYNFLLHVDYLIVSNGLTHYCCKMNYENNSYMLLTSIPDYKDI